MFILTFAIPLIVLIIAYTLMIIFISRTKMTANRKQNAKVIKMGVSLVFVFAICTGFQHFFFFITSSFSTIEISMEKLSVLFVVSNFFVSLQASINPFLYGNIQSVLINRKKKTRKVSLYVTRNDTTLHTVTTYHRNCSVPSTDTYPGGNICRMEYKQDGETNENHEIKGNYPFQTRNGIKQNYEICEEYHFNDNTEMYISNLLSDQYLPKYNLKENTQSCDVSEIYDVNYNLHFNSSMYEFDKSILNNGDQLLLAYECGYFERETIL